MKSIVTPILKKSDKKFASIIYDWDRIMTHPISQLSKPEKITFKKGSVAGGTLHLKISPSIALQVQHTQNQLIEKINQFYGYEIVRDLKFSQAHFNIDAKVAEPKLSSKTTQFIDDKIEAIENQDLKESLKKFGHALYKHDQKSK